MDELLGRFAARVRVAETCLIDAASSDLPTQREPVEAWDGPAMLDRRAVRIEPELR